MTTLPRFGFAGLLLPGILLGLPALPAQAAVRACTAPVAVPCHTARAHRVRLREARVRYPRRHYGYAPVIPPYDPVESWAEVHQVYPYRTPYPYPALFGPY